MALHKEWGNAHWSKPMPAVGQGVFIFHLKINNPFKIVLRRPGTINLVCLKVEKDKVTSVVTCEECRLDRTACRDITEQVDTPNCGYEAGETIAYWISYDRDRCVVKYGKGYIMEETTLLTHDLMKNAKTGKEKDKMRQKLHPLFNANKNVNVEFYAVVAECDIRGNMEFHRNPFVRNLSPFVKDGSEATLSLLDSDEYLLSGNLPASCRTLYENVRKCELNWSPQVDNILLSDAIRYSIKTEGCLLYTKLKEKGRKLGSGHKEKCYLRITLGHSYGNSPGIPYVLEIWPSGNFSPIHNHGNANAVIKVLFGTILVKCYNRGTKSEDAKPLKTFHVKQGDVTWIDRNWFQTHKLHNVSNDFCATLQCYMYDSDDKTHWPYFDYVKKNNVIDAFLPNSDFDFKDMQKHVINEFEDFLPGVRKIFPNVTCK